MAWTFDVNNSCLVAGDIGKSFLIWKDKGVASSILEVLGSGDGRTAFENSGQTAGPNYDVLTGGSSVWNSGVDNEWSNTNAWLRVRVIGTTLEFIIQRQSSSSASYESAFKILVSPTGFTSGGASATVRPTGTDQQYLLGSAVAFGTFASYNTDMHIHVGFNETANANGFHSFYLALNYTASKQLYAVWLFDCVDQAKTGDAQDWVTYIYTGSTPLSYAYLGYISATYGQSYYDYGGASEAFYRTEAQHLVNGSNNAFFPSYVGIQPEDSKTRSFPIVWGCVAYTFYKGVSSFIEWKGIAARNYPDTVDLASTDAKVYFDDVLLPWEQGTAPL
jgi:hypothetical protein